MTLFKLLTAFVFCVAASTSIAQTVSGKLVHVRDADTIEIATSRGRIAIRLNGVDVPELDERGGRAGKTWMQRNYHGKPLTCTLNGDRTHDRWVGICLDQSGTDIGAAVISAGYARDCPRFSGGRYRTYETAASRALPKKNYCKPR